MKYIIAGLSLSLPDKLVHGHFEQALTPFIATPEGNPDLVVEAVDGAITPEGTCTVIDQFDFADADAECSFRRDANSYLLDMIPHDGSPTATFRASLDGSHAVTNYTPGVHLPSLFRFGVWMAFNLSAIHHNKIAIHSSVDLYKGACIMALGESGTGKSTHTRLWRENIADAKLLNDDSPIVYIEGSEVRVSGSPWSGKTPCYRNKNYPIQGIIRLSQAPHNRIRPLRPIEAIGALLPSCPPQFAQDKDLFDRICEIVSKIVAGTRFYHLECLPDAEAAFLACRTLYGEEPEKR